MNTVKNTFTVVFIYLICALVIGMGCTKSNPLYVGMWIANKVNDNFVDNSIFRANIEFYNDNTFKYMVINKDKIAIEGTGSCTILDNNRIKLQLNDPSKTIIIGEIKDDTLIIGWSDANVLYEKEKIAKPIVASDIDPRQAILGIDGYKFGDKIYPMCKGYKISKRNNTFVIYDKNNVTLHTVSGIFESYMISFGNQDQKQLVDNIMKIYGKPKDYSNPTWTSNDGKIELNYYKDKYGDYHLSIEHKALIIY